MLKNSVIFEDIGSTEFAPLSYTHGIFELKYGILNNLERVQHHFSEVSLSILCRPHLSDLMRHRYPSININGENLGLSALVINSRIKLSIGMVRTIKAKLAEALPFMIVCDGSLVAGFLDKKAFETFRSAQKAPINTTPLLKELAKTTPFTEIKGSLFNYPWDLLEANERFLTEDFDLLNLGGIIKGSIDASAVLNKEDAIFIDKKATLSPFVYCDASAGPIYIDKGVVIDSHTTIKGPCYLGPFVFVASHSAIRSCSIDSGCKVGGEIAKSIILSNTNKVHTGFVGNSYIGSWVNLGAGTTISNLKNSYGAVSTISSKGLISTGLTFFGAIIGDYTKTAINSSINSGSRIGFGCMLAGTGLLPKKIPSLSWLTGAGTKAYDIKKLSETTKLVYERRSKEFTLLEETLLKFLSQSLKKEKEFEWLELAT